MDFRAWNIRGLGDLVKKAEARSLVSSKKIRLFAILDTKIDESKPNVVMRGMFPGWNFVANYRQSYKGRIWVC